MQDGLVERAQRGDAEAFDALARLVGDRCLAIAVRILRDLDLAEDAVQGALITAWTSSARCAIHPASIRGSTGCTRAAVTTDGRGYFFWLYTGGDDPSLAGTYDEAWFKEVLATVQLQP